MSGMRRLLFGGAICCLIISLVFPVTSGNGSNSHSEVSAAVGPEFKKSKLESDSESEKKEHSKAEAKSPLMQELQQAYNKNDQAKPGTVQLVSSQKKASTKEKKASPKKQPKQQKKSRNIFGRAYDKYVRKSGSKSDSDSVAKKESLYAPERTPNANRLPSKSSKSVALKEPAPPKQSEPAPIIIPPQPQPNFLPGLEMTDIEAIKPAITAGVKPLEGNDPFPLPPLPTEIGAPAAPKKSEPVDVAETVQKPEANTSPMQIALPLPGIDTDVVANEPEAPEAEMAVEQPVELSEPKVAVQESTEELVNDQQFSEPFVEAVEQEIEGFASNEEMIVEDIQSVKKGNLPPAPSAMAPAPSVSEPLVKQQQLPPTYQGWRKRNSQASNQEPNALNIPEEARPAALPNPAVVHKEDPAEKYRRIAERGDRSGFKGFCPVVLREQLELVDASPEYQVEFEGAIYYLSTESAMTQFEEAPGRYAPVQGGIDLVKYSKQGVEEAGRLDYAVWYRDQLYLFSSQERMDQFKSESETFVPEK